MSPAHLALLTTNHKPLAFARLIPRGSPFFLRCESADFAAVRPLGPLIATH